MMSPISIARPYAQAIFAYAVEKKKLAAWSALLTQAEKVIKVESMQSLLKNPCIDKMEAYECLLVLCKSVIFAAGRNFLRLMALNRRLLVLPQVKYLFEQYKAEQDKQVVAHVTSAIALTKSEEKNLLSALSQRLQRQVILYQHVDDYLLGGLIVRIKDLVIDDSVRGKLERLRATLVN